LMMDKLLIFIINKKNYNTKNVSFVVFMELPWVVQNLKQKQTLEYVKNIIIFHALTAAVKSNLQKTKKHFVKFVKIQEGSRLVWLKLIVIQIILQSIIQEER